MAGKEATTDDFQRTAREIVANWINDNTEKRYPEETDITASEVLIVSSCKTLQHWKATLFSKYRKDWYFEVTINGIARQVYLDAYHKNANVCIDMKECGYF